jgi:fido (protein-threonine AMPylation protein)
MPTIEKVNTGSPIDLTLHKHRRFKKWEVMRHPPWMTDEEFDELNVFVNSTDFSQYEHAPTLEFAKHKLIVLVYTSNKLEQTIPKGCSEHETYALLKRLLDNTDSAFSEEKHWKADGDNVGSAASAQMQQHLLAAQYLMSHTRPLDVNVICNTHKILMANALDKQGVAVVAGTFRRIPVHAGQHAFPDWTTIPTSIDKLLNEINTLMGSDDDTHAVSIAARLFYKLVCIHPFPDGNGRLCRLLVAWVLCRKASVPFPVTMSSGKTKSRKHYISAILHGHRGYGFDHLETLVAWSLWHDWQNLQVNMSLL